MNNMNGQPEIVIRLLDLDGSRLAKAERDLHRRLEALNIKAKILPLACGLEIARQGFTDDTPALLMNQYTCVSGKELTEDVLDTFCQQLVTWIARHSS